MRTFQLVPLFVTVALMTLMPLAAFAQDSPAAPVSEAAPQPLMIFTAYPAQVVGLGETVSLPLKVRAAAPQSVNLSVENVPENWQMSFRGGNRTVSAVYVDGQNDASVDLRVEPAADSGAGDYQLQIVATGDGETARLPVTLTVEEKAPPKLTMDTDLPTLRGKSTSPFRYNVNLKNDGADDLNVNLMADAPPAFVVTFSLNGQDVTAVPVAAGESKRLSVEARALNEVPAASYPIQVNALGGEVSASLALTAEVVGQPDLSLTTPDGRISGDASAGSATAFSLVLANTGSAPARNIALSSSAPTNWNVSLEPKEVPELMPGQTVDVKASVQPADKAINGDYVVSYSARSDDASAKNLDMRITVMTSTLWGVVGIGLIALAVVAVGLAVSRFGRR